MLLCKICCKSWVPCQKETGHTPPLAAPIYGGRRARGQIPTSVAYSICYGRHINILSLTMRKSVKHGGHDASLEALISPRLIYLLFVYCFHIFGMSHRDVCLCPSHLHRNSDFLNHGPRWGGRHTRTGSDR